MLVCSTCVLLLHRCCSKTGHFLAGGGLDEEVMDWDGGDGRRGKDGSGDCVGSSDCRGDVNSSDVAVQGTVGRGYVISCFSREQNWRMLSYRYHWRSTGSPGDGMTGGRSSLSGIQFSFNSFSSLQHSLQLASPQPHHVWQQLQWSVRRTRYLGNIWSEASRRLSSHTWEWWISADKLSKVVHCWCLDSGCQFIQAVCLCPSKLLFEKPKAPIWCKLGMPSKHEQ